MSNNFKIIRINDDIIVQLSDGSTVYSVKPITDAEWNTIKNADNLETVLNIVNPKALLYSKSLSTIDSIMSSISESKLLSLEGESIYWNEISKLSLPQTLVESILIAEKHNDEILIETYKNFWTLMSLNTDETCRKNLFWFLNKNNFIISRSGFFVAYRNVSTTNEKGVYTDNHTKTFKIKIGEMVVMDRNKCDCNSNHECSSGLHLASAEWLKRNYFGDVGLICLCNPADVCAVPYNSKYGKLRTSAYLPIDFINYNGDDVIPYDRPNGFECEYIPKIIYEGIMGTEKDTPYKLSIPEDFHINRTVITDRLLEIAKESIKQKVLNDEQKN